VVLAGVALSAIVVLAERIAQAGPGELLGILVLFGTQVVVETVAVVGSEI